MLTCLNCRAIHIEVLESLDSSAFICALRRFFAIRGPVRKKDVIAERTLSGQKWNWTLRF